METEKNYEERFLEMVKHAEEGWKTFDRMVDKPIRPMKCLWFLEEEFESVEQIVSKLELEDEHFGLERFATKRRRITLLAKHFPKITEALNEQWISYVEIPVVAISTLPVEDQRKFRRR